MAHANRDVFLNCPFDRRYRSLFDAIVFTVFACGFRARTMLDNEDSGKTRLERLIAVIVACPYSVHDLSRINLSARGGWPRFNVLLELGLCLGAARFGRRDMRCLILDAKPLRYRDAASDLAGQDIRSHGHKPGRAIQAVRSFLAAQSTEQPPGGGAIAKRHAVFRAQLPRMIQAAAIAPEEREFRDLARCITGWLKLTSQA